jgi:hypothetical protein
MGLNAANEKRTNRTPRADRMICVIRGEFDEMPGMRLTRAQFRRLWHLTADESDRLVRELIAAGFLVEDARGHISRAPQAH